MTRRLAAFVLAAIGLSAGMYGQVTYGQGGQNGAVPNRSDYAPIELNVACGDLRGPSCAMVLPKIAVRAAQSGLTLNAVESGGALGTFSDVCEGRAAAAIVQRDVVAYLARNPACVGHYDIVGHPIYPYYAFLVVRAGAPFRTLDDMVGNLPDGQKRTIAATTGGQVTITFLFRSNPALERAIAISNDDLATALDKITAGTMDGFFTIETLNSDLMDRVRLKVDAGGKPLYRFIDVRAVADFMRIGDDGGHCLYRLTALDFGAKTPVTTISVDAVMVLGQAFREAHARSGPKAPDALASAIAATQTVVLSDMKSPRDWRPSVAACK